MTQVATHHELQRWRTNGSGSHHQERVPTSTCNTTYINCPRATAAALWCHHALPTTTTTHSDMTAVLLAGQLATAPWHRHQLSLEAWPMVVGQRRPCKQVDPSTVPKRRGWQVPWLTGIRDGLDECNARCNDGSTLCDSLASTNFLSKNSFNDIECIICESSNSHAQLSQGELHNSTIMSIRDNDGEAVYRWGIWFRPANIISNNHVDSSDTSPGLREGSWFSILELEP